MGRQLARLPSFSVLPRPLTTIASSAPFLLQRHIETLGQLAERVRSLAQVLILCLQFFEFVLTFLQRFWGRLVGLHGLLSRCRRRCKRQTRIWTPKQAVGIR